MCLLLAGGGGNDSQEAVDGLTVVIAARPTGARPPPILTG